MVAARVAQPAMASACRGRRTRGGNDKTRAAMERASLFTGSRKSGVIAGDQQPWVDAARRTPERTPAVSYPKKRGEWRNLSECVSGAAGRPIWALPAWPVPAGWSAQAVRSACPGGREDRRRAPPPFRPVDWPSPAEIVRHSLPGVP